MRFTEEKSFQKPSWRAAKERSVLRMTGPDRLRWLNGLVTCNVEMPSREQYGLLLEKKGKIETDFHHVATEGSLYLVLPNDRIDAIYTILDHHLIMEDVELSKVALIPTWHFRPLPSAADANAPPPASSNGEHDEPSANVVLRGIGGDARIEATLVLSPEPRPGEGASLSDDEWNALRLHAGVPAYGVDFDGTMYPQEASLEEWAVAFDKGCYMGQEVVYMMQNRGHARRRLTHLTMSSDVESEAVAPNAEVKDEGGMLIGSVKSAIAVAGKTYVIALLKSSSAAQGATVRLGDAHAVVTGAPITTAKPKS